MVVGVPAVAVAYTPKPAIRVTPTASSSLDAYQPWMAVEASDVQKQAWCAKGDGVGETFVLTFDAPLPVTGLDIAAGLRASGSFSFPERLEVKTDAQTIELKPSSASWSRAALNGSATRSITIKIAAVTPGKTKRTCLTSVRVLAPDTHFYQFVYGFDRAALDALPAFAKQLDAAFKRCDDAALAKMVKLPLEHRHVVHGVMDQEVPPPKTVKYRSIAELVKACRSDGSRLALGFEAGADDADLAKELPAANTYMLGELEVGGEDDHHWALVRDDSAWKLASVHTSEAAFHADTTGRLLR